MSRICVDAEGYELLHPDGTHAHEDCPCGGGGPQGPCCEHGRFCGFPALTIARCRAVGVIESRVPPGGPVLVPYDVTEDIPLNMGTCNDTTIGAGGSIPGGHNWDFTVTVRFQPVGGVFQNRPGYPIVAGAFTARIPCISVRFDIYSRGNMIFAYDVATPPGWTAITPLSPGGEVTGSAQPPAIRRMAGTCPAMVGAFASVRRTGAPLNYTGFSADVSVDLINATGCGNIGGLPGGPDGIPPGWEWTPYGPAPKGCHGCG